MARIKLSLPLTFSFFTIIPVRITDINYGNHVGNDAVLSLLHEARMQYLSHFGFSEMKFDTASLIMADVAIEFKAELFYGDSLKAYVTADEFTRAGFEIYYKLVKGVDEAVVALAKTGMICFDYETKKVTSVPEVAAKKLKA